MAKKKKKKHRGKRTHGRGNTKHGRGKGSRKSTSSKKGGRNYMHLVKKGKIRKKGFSTKKPEEKGINLTDINEFITEETEEINLKEHGYDKVLGGGQLKKPVKIKARKFSNSAERKIEEEGGEAIKTDK
ncbi:MAG: uL15 family ribosomal protein [archaeon]